MNKELLQYCKIYKGEINPPELDKYDLLIWMCERNAVNTINENGFKTQKHHDEFREWVAAFINKWRFDWWEIFSKYFSDDKPFLDKMTKIYE